MNNYEIDVGRPPQEVMIALSLIEDFQKKNKTKYNIKIDFDYGMEYSAGEFDEEKPNVIYLNPDNCLPTEESLALGSVEDGSIFGTMMHEFAHLILLGHRVDVRTAYLKNFNLQRQWINDYCETDIEEEMAEVFRLYLVNPLLLKLILPDAFKFFKKQFKSPSPCSQKHTVAMYNDFSWTVKEHLRDTFGIDHDVYEDKIIKHI